LINKIRKFNNSLRTQPFFLLARPKEIIYECELARNSFKEDIKYIVGQGLKNLEVPWSENKNWLALMSDIRASYPKIQIGSASIVNKKSIDDSLKVGLNFSMMRFWQKDLYIYSKKKNFLLIPGLTNIKDLEEAISLSCKIIKIFPVNNKNEKLDIKKYNEISFIAAGGIALKDLNKFKRLGYKGIVIGKTGYDGKLFDPDILKWLDNNNYS